MLRSTLSVVLLSGLLPLSAPSVSPGLEEHCVVYVVGQHEDGEFIVTNPECYVNLSEVRIASARRALDSAFVDDAKSVLLASFTLGQHFDGFNGSGSSISIVGGSCTGGHWNTPTNWDNRISSSYNGCARLRHYDQPSKAGVHEDTGGVGQTDNLSALNNKTESVSYHSS